MILSSDGRWKKKFFWGGLCFFNSDYLLPLLKSLVIFLNKHKVFIWNMSINELIIFTQYAVDCYSSDPLWQEAHMYDNLYFMYDMLWFILNSKQVSIVYVFKTKKNPQHQGEVALFMGQAPLVLTLQMPSWRSTPGVSNDPTVFWSLFQMSQYN